MFTTLTYGPKNNMTAQVVMPREFMGSPRGREEYREIHEFLTDMFNQSTRSNKKEIPTTSKASTQVESIGCDTP